MLRPKQLWTERSAPTRALVLESCEKLVPIADLRELTILNLQPGRSGTFRLIGGAHSLRHDNCFSPLKNVGGTRGLVSHSVMFGLRTTKLDVPI